MDSNLAVELEPRNFEELTTGIGSDEEGSATKRRRKTRRSLGRRVSFADAPTIRIYDRDEEVAPSPARVQQIDQVNGSPGRPSRTPWAKVEVASTGDKENWVPVAKCPPEGRARQNFKKPLEVTSPDAGFYKETDAIVDLSNTRCRFRQEVADDDVTMDSTTFTQRFSEFQTSNHPKEPSGERGCTIELMKNDARVNEEIPSTGSVDSDMSLTSVHHVVRTKIPEQRQGLGNGECDMSITMQVPWNQKYATDPSRELTATLSEQLKDGDLLGKKSLIKELVDDLSGSKNLQYEEELTLANKKTSSTSEPDAALGAISHQFPAAVVDTLSSLDEGVTSSETILANWMPEESEVRTNRNELSSYIIATPSSRCPNPDGAGTTGPDSVVANYDDRLTVTMDITVPATLRSDFAHELSKQACVDLDRSITMGIPSIQDLVREEETDTSDDMVVEGKSMIESKYRMSPTVFSCGNKKLYGEEDANGSITLGIPRLSDIIRDEEEEYTEDSMDLVTESNLTQSMESLDPRKLSGSEDINSPKEKHLTPSTLVLDDSHVLPSNEMRDCEESNKESPEQEEMLPSSQQQGSVAHNQVSRQPNGVELYVLSSSLPLIKTLNALVEPIGQQGQSQLSSEPNVSERRILSKVEQDSRMTQAPRVGENDGPYTDSLTTAGQPTGLTDNVETGQSMFSDGLDTLTSVDKGAKRLIGELLTFLKVKPSPQPRQAFVHQSLVPLMDMEYVKYIVKRLFLDPQMLHLVGMSKRIEDALTGIRMSAVIAKEEVATANPSLLSRFRSAATTEKQAIKDRVKKLISPRRHEILGIWLKFELGTEEDWRATLSKSTCEVDSIYSKLQEGNQHVVDVFKRMEELDDAIKCMAKISVVTPVKLNGVITPGFSRSRKEFLLHKLDDQRIRNRAKLERLQTRMEASVENLRRSEEHLEAVRCQVQKLRTRLEESVCRGHGLSESKPLSATPDIYLQELVKKESFVNCLEDGLQLTTLKPHVLELSYSLFLRRRLEVLRGLNDKNAIKSTWELECDLIELIFPQVNAPDVFKYILIDHLHQFEGEVVDWKPWIQVITFFLDFKFIDVMLSTRVSLSLNLARGLRSGYPCGEIPVKVGLEFCSPSIAQKITVAAFEEAVNAVETGYRRFERICSAVGSILASGRN